MRSARRPCVALLAGALTLAVLAPTADAAGSFPPGFLWGTANAGFQSEAGQGRHTDPNSDWFVWTHDPANIADGTVSGDQPESGPGFWKLFRDDLDLAANQLHNDAFRFSVEWPRIFPRSTESVDVGARIDQQELRRLDKLANQRAVRHYRRVLRAANRRGLTPFVTLHHWTIPSWLHDPVATRAALASRGPNDPLPELAAGGWLDPDTVGEFRKYAAYLGWKLGDRADYWNTLNEPMVQVTNGFVNVPGLFGAYWPPGVFSFTGAIAALINLERANTVAYDALKRFDRADADGDRRDARVGPVMNMVAFTPADPTSPGDQQATEHADYLFNRLFLNARRQRATSTRTGTGRSSRRRPACTRARPISSASTTTSAAVSPPPGRRCRPRSRSSTSSPRSPTGPRPRPRRRRVRRPAASSAPRSIRRASARCSRPRAAIACPCT